MSTRRASGMITAWTAVLLAGGAASVASAADEREGTGWLDRLPTITLSGSAGEGLPGGLVHLSGRELTVRPLSGSASVSASASAEGERDGRRVRVEATGRGDVVVVSPEGEIRIVRSDDKDGGQVVRGAVTSRPMSRAMLGITMSEPSSALLEHLGLETAVQIESVMEGLPAEKAGLQRNDLIVGVNGQQPMDIEALRRLIREKSPGDEIVLEVVRRGQSMKVTVTLQKPSDPVAGHQIDINHGSMLHHLTQELENALQRRDSATMRSLRRHVDSARFHDQATRERARQVLEQIRGIDIKDIPSELRERWDEVIGDDISPADRRDSMRTLFELQALAESLRHMDERIRSRAHERLEQTEATLRQRLQESMKREEQTRRRIRESADRLIEELEDGPLGEVLSERLGKLEREGVSSREIESLRSLQRGLIELRDLQSLRDSPERTLQRLTEVIGDSAHRPADGGGDGRIEHRLEGVEQRLERIEQRLERIAERLGAGG